MHCSICLFHISSLDKFSVVVLDRLFFIGRQKKVTGCVRQLVIYKVKIVGEICLGGLSIGHLRRVVSLQGLQSEQV